MQENNRKKLVKKSLNPKSVVLVALIGVITAVMYIAIFCRNPAEISFEQASEIAHKHFNSVHNMFIMVKDVSYKKVAQRDYLNFITVFHGKTEYTLILDKRNKPASDNVVAINTIQSIDLSSFDGKLRELGLERHDYYDLEALLSLTDFQYKTAFSVVHIDRPNRDSKDDIYNFLEELKKEGIDTFIVNINSPSFLRPKFEYGHGMHGLRLIEFGVDTDIGLEAFSEKYYNFVDRVHWNKQKFDEQIEEMTSMGYENAYFYISRWATGNILEIVLYCESDGSLSDEPALSLLEKIDESYFDIGEINTEYTLQHKK